IAEYTDPLTRELARAVEDAVLPKAGEQNTAQLARAAGRAVGRLDPGGAAARHQERKKERRVELRPGEDGMAELMAVLPAADAMRIHQIVTQYAGAGRAARDGRSMDQLRADALCDLLLDPRFGVLRSSGVQVQVTVALTTLMGLDEQPAELAGYGPIPAPVARELAGDGTWRRLVTDPLSGQLLDYGRTTYRPPAGLADFVRARDQRCIFPRCTRPPPHPHLPPTPPPPPPPPPARPPAHLHPRLPAPRAPRPQAQTQLAPATRRRPLHLDHPHRRPVHPPPTPPRHTTAPASGRRTTTLLTKPSGNSVGSR